MQVYLSTTYTLNHATTHAIHAIHATNTIHDGTILRRAHRRGAVSAGTHRRIKQAHERTQHSIRPAAAPNVRAPGADQVRHHAHSGSAQTSHRAAPHLSDLQSRTGVQPGQRGGPMVGLRHGGQRGIHAAQPVFWAATVRAGRVRAVVQERPVQRAH